MSPPINESCDLCCTVTRVSGAVICGLAHMHAACLNCHASGSSPSRHVVTWRIVAAPPVNGCTPRIVLSEMSFQLEFFTSVSWIVVGICVIAMKGNAAVHHGRQIMSQWLPSIVYQCLAPCISQAFPSSLLVLVNSSASAMCYSVLIACFCH